MYILTDKVIAIGPFETRHEAILYRESMKDDRTYNFKIMEILYPIALGKIQKENSYEK